MTRYEQWLGWRAEGMSFAAIAERAGISRQRVHQILAGGCGKRGRHMDVETVRHIRTSGESISDIARRVGVSYRAVRLVRIGETWRDIA